MHHPHCIACRPREQGGLGLRFDPAQDGSVRCEFFCDECYQGYPDRLHGGIIAMLLDAGMTHWLLHAGVRGFTAKLNIRYHLPTVIGEPASVRGYLTDKEPPLYILRGEIHQGGQLRASAEGTFWADAEAPPATASTEP